ncbi:ABC transporter permease [Oleiagrimonas citrea]|jgi:putative ABC transport system permease protein|uniref:FtsX-like permease family protein n=1 Tax=Oleiagrimonas citrea TaxID=1665687 RepID=A0A846ZKC7_9GAMM|nr:FtsX-like permease family protein [Oleiagrimonas citrea]NKZ38167.1 FtsX-like permease family protein [Oleiagrimonas citrea]
MDILPILASLRRHKVTALLLILQIALTCAIVCNAVFLISQRLHRMQLPSGMAEHELVQIRLGSVGDGSDAKSQTQADVAALQRIPGVQQVAVVNQLPFTEGDASNGDLKLKPGQQTSTLTVAQYFGQNVVSTMGLHLLAGRNFQPEEYVDLDTALASLNNGSAQGFPQTVIITKGLAERLWPGEEALGKTFYLGGDIPFRVIGVVADLARPNQFYNGIENSILWPMRLTFAEGGSYLIRCAPGARRAVLKAGLAKLKELDPGRVVLEKRTYDDARSAFFAHDSAMSDMLLSVIIALLLVTGLGIVGLASFWVGQRRRQIGVRRALGATRGDILRYFQIENFLIVGFGIVLGMAMAYGLSLLLMQHYALPRLPFGYLPLGALALWLLGQCAVLAPALRAAAVPPVVATRTV